MTAFNTGALNPLSSPAASTDKRVYEPSMEEILASIRRIIADDQSLPGRGATERQEERTEPPAELRRATDSDDLASQHRSGSIHEPAQTERLAPSPAAPEAAPKQVATVAERVATTHENLEPVSSPNAHAYGTIAAPQYPMPDRGLEDADRVVSPVETAAPDLRTRFDVDDGIRGGGHEDLAPTPSHHAPAMPEAAAAADDGAFDEPLEPAAAASREAPSLFSAATDTSVSSAFNLLAASRLADNSDELMNLAREMIRPLLRNWLDDNLPSMVERMVRAEIERVARGGR